MARTIRIYADHKIPGWALEDVNLEAAARGQLERLLTGEAAGPKGGRYLLFGDTTYHEKVQIEADRDRDVWTIRASRMGRYVRP